MAYEPTVWECGDAITAEKMNNIEEGIVNNEPLIANFVQQDDPQTTFRFDKTFGEIYDAVYDGRTVVVRTHSISDSTSYRDINALIIGVEIAYEEMWFDDTQQFELGYIGRMHFSNPWSLTFETYELPHARTLEALRTINFAWDYSD